MNLVIGIQGVPPLFPRWEDFREYQAVQPPLMALRGSRRQECWIGGINRAEGQSGIFLFPLISSLLQGMAMSVLGPPLASSLWPMGTA
jgi:hypothetical protein